MEIHFHGLVTLQGSELNLAGGSELLKLQVCSKVRLEAYSPSVSFGKYWMSFSMYTHFVDAAICQTEGGLSFARRRAA